jgi:hypothetical protein
MQLPCTFCLRLQLASRVDTDTCHCPASQQLVMVPMVPDVRILGLYRTNGVPEDMDSSVDDYAAASSVDEYTAGSATGDIISTRQQPCSLPRCKSVCRFRNCRAVSTVAGALLERAAARARRQQQQI